MALLFILIGSVTVSVSVESFSVDHIELIDFSDLEHEKEEKKKEIEEEKKIQSTNSSDRYFLNDNLKISDSPMSYLDCHKGDIPTPPPEHNV